VAYGVEVADTPEDLALPFGLQFIKRSPDADMPTFMTPIFAVASKEEEELKLHFKMAEGEARDSLLSRS
jgi:hypothetical protein